MVTKTGVVSGCTMARHPHCPAWVPLGLPCFPGKLAGLQPSGLCGWCLLPWWQALAPRVDWALPFFAGIYCAITHWSQLPSRVCLGGGGGGGRNFLEEDERSENLGQETQPGVRSVLKITQWAAQDVPPDS